MSYIALAGIVCVVALVAAMFYIRRDSPQVRCTFDRNELGPMSEHGQWYYDVYKCDDGTERRELVASPRG